MNNWEKLGNDVNNAFYFVIDKIIDLQAFFLNQALGIGKVVLLIAIITTGLNYALTGTGLKENIIKILKATVFFFIVIFLYPRIIGWMTTYTFNLAAQSVYPAVRAHFGEVVGEIEEKSTFVLFEYSGQIDMTHHDFFYGGALINDNLTRDTFSARTFTRSIIREVIRDNQRLFNNLSTTRHHPNGMSYTVVAPAAVFKIIVFIAGECIQSAESNQNFIQNLAPSELSRTLKGLICGFFVIITGVFAILEYVSSFLEFMLVTSVGIILFPLSLWEGSKFIAEKFIGAIVGFFIKMVFINVSIFLMIYGYVSLFYIVSDPESGGFAGTTDQIVFIVFSSLLFFFICKGAPAAAQSLMTGTPSLNATGAIKTAAGALGAAAATVGIARRVGKTIGHTGAAVVGGVAKTAFGAGGSLSEAAAASSVVKQAGGSGGQQFGAFMSSIGKDIGEGFKAAGLGLTRSLLGGKDGGANPYSWKDDFINRNDDGSYQSFGEHFNARKNEGTSRGQDYIGNYGAGDQQYTSSLSSIDRINRQENT
jgi:hypothetical protein